MSLNNPTTNLVLERQAAASNANTWGDRANANFTRIDQAISGSVAVAVTVADVTLTTTDTGDLVADAQSRYFNIELSGALTGNRNVIVPATARLYRVNNSCSGAFTVTLKTSGGTGVAVPQGGALMLWCDATNVVEHQTPTSAAVTKVFWGGTSGGSANAQTVTLAPVPTAYGTGMPIRFISGFANTTTAPTLNVNSLGAKTIVRPDNTTVQVGDIPSGLIIDVEYDGTSFRLVTMPSNAVVGVKNAIINGDFRIAQRGTSFSSPATSAYTLDRWVIGYDGTAGTFVVSQANLGVTSAPSKYAFNWSQTVAGSGGTFRQIIQRIEGAHQFAGQTVTVSFTTFTSGSSFTLGTLFGQVFGTGGSPSSSVFTAGQNVTVSGTTTRNSLTFSIPSISAKTLGSNGDDYLELVFSVPLNATFNLLLWDVLVELGGVATAFERKPVGLETLLCQRYYQTAAANWTRNGTSGSTYTETIPYVVPMRATPTATTTGVSKANVGADTITGSAQYAYVSIPQNASTFYVWSGTCQFSAEL